MNCLLYVNFLSWTKKNWNFDLLMAAQTTWLFSRIGHVEEYQETSAWSVEAKVWSLVHT